MSEPSPRGVESCQGRRFASLLGFILVIGGCADEPKKPNYLRTQPDEPVIEHKPLETTRTNRSEVRVDATIQGPEPLTGAVEIKTWANEVIRGRIVAERRDAYDLDIGPLDGSNPKIRMVSRSAVMELKKLRGTP